MSKFRFVFVSKNDDFRFDRDFTEKYSAANPDAEFDYVSGNEIPLPVVYNSFLKEPKTLEYDYLVLVHADVRFDLDEFIKHVDSVAGKYDVMGLCGCSKISVGVSPLNWFCGSQSFPNDRWGCVTHGEIGGQVAFYNRHSPDVTDREVACVDGLCIIFTKKAVESGILFDEKLGAWDMYDTDISFQAVMKYGLKLGVIVRPDLVHYSIGKSIMTNQFLETELLFRKKWNFDIPEKSRLKQLADEKAAAAAGVKS